jgi:hypothetical protein
MDRTANENTNTDSIEYSSLMYIVLVNVIPVIDLTRLFGVRVTDRDNKKMYSLSRENFQTLCHDLSCLSEVMDDTKTPLGAVHSYIDRLQRCLVGPPCCS